VLYVIDYFQLLDVAKPGTAAIEADNQRIELLQAIQSVSRTFQCPGGDSFLVVSEVRKGESGRPRLALDDLLGSARITYSADCVLLLETDGESTSSAPGTTPLLLTVAKGRDGMTRGRVRLTFEYDRYQFREAIGPTQMSGDQEHTGSRSAGRFINPLAGAKE
jgi:replicative DNA helicase